MKNRINNYLFWALWVGIIFFSVYPTTNWLTSHRNELFSFYFTSELNIPFVPEFIWFYMSMYLLFLLPPFFLSVEKLPLLGKQLIAGTLIGGGIFLLFPAELGFSRVVPEEPIYQQLFTNIFNLDHPHNLLPSLHVVFSACISIAIIMETRGHLRWLFIIWLIAILTSTVLVHQHHLLDVLTGLFLTAIVRHLYRKE